VPVWMGMRMWKKSARTTTVRTTTTTNDAECDMGGTQLDNYSTMMITKM
jgi:hypothetical protein